jgi:cobyrinic acid a,c-diamide synthase
VKNTEKKRINAFCIAGTSSGSGKTTVSLALMRALRRRNLALKVFKCGPDYIDPTYHNKAAGVVSRNLDCWIMGEQEVRRAFFESISNDCDCAVIEGVMGLYDASRPDTIHGSTAEISIMLKVPVILTVNAKGMAGSIAAVVKGYAEFHPEINIIGVIANQVGSEKHAELLKSALESASLPPLVGFLPKNSEFTLPERHLGLVPSEENKNPEIWFDKLADAAEAYFDFDLIFRLSEYSFRVVQSMAEKREKMFTVAIARDKAFSFYYEDNLDILKQSGFNLIEFSPLDDSSVPEADMLYLGGGFPEIFAEKLAANVSMRKSVKEFADSGKIVFAECGGFMYLTNSITLDEKKYPMCGVVNADASMEKRLRSLGYRKVKTAADSFWGAAGTEFKGHEFHWSGVEYPEPYPPAWYAKGSKPDAEYKQTGVHFNNVFASYIHLHFASNRNAVKNIINFLKENKECNKI